MYKASWINRWEHGCCVEYDLLLVDDAGILPNQRIPKSFCNGKYENMCSDVVISTDDPEQEVLRDIAAIEIQRILDGYTTGDIG